MIFYIFIVCNDYCIKSVFFLNLHHLSTPASISCSATAWSSLSLSSWCYPKQTGVILLMVLKSGELVKVGSLSLYLHGLLHPRWLLGISSINSLNSIEWHQPKFHAQNKRKSLKFTIDLHQCWSKLGTGYCNWMMKLRKAVYAAALFCSRNTLKIHQILEWQKKPEGRNLSWW